MNVLTVLMIAVEFKPLLFLFLFSLFLFKGIHRQSITLLESRFFPSHLTKVKGIFLLWKLDSSLSPTLSSFFFVWKIDLFLCILRGLRMRKKSFYKENSSLPRRYKKYEKTRLRILCTSSKTIEDDERGS